ncbi:MAG: HAD family hydrolase [Kineosporiaceae bacterium]|nr:HAD family hydrolase [Kineosporiaceae bacterium]MBK7623072.1 HAD family hydrolase [Kineosporiaceae bacterium]
MSELRDGGLVVGFDLDMTLVDSAEGIAATVTAALADFGHVTTAQEVWALNGVPLEQTMTALAPGIDAAAAARRYRELYPRLGVPAIRLLPGALDALAAVKRSGGTTVIVSTKVERAVRLVVEAVGLRVDAVAGGLFAQAKGGYLREVGAHVYVGDHPGDVLAARAAGATSVAVATGPHPASALAAAGADVVLADLLAFPGWLAGRGTNSADV